MKFSGSGEKTMAAKTNQWKPKNMCKFTLLATHNCTNHSNLEMEPKYPTQSDVQLNPNIART